MSANYPRATTLAVGDTVGPDYFVTPQFKGKILLNNADLNKSRRKRNRQQIDWFGWGIDQFGNEIDDDDDDDFDENDSSIPETAEPIKLKWHHWVLMGVIGFVMIFVIRDFLRRRR